MYSAYIYSGDRVAPLSGETVRDITKRRKLLKSFRKEKSVMTEMAAVRHISHPSPQKPIVYFNHS